MARKPIALTGIEVAHLLDYLEELDALIEADDGTLFPLPLIDKHETVKELVYGQVID